MNRKGFTFIEVLAVIVVLGIVSIITMVTIQNTFSVTEEKSYEIMKDNIISSSKNYLLECENNLIECQGEYYWTGNSTSFYAYNLINHGYFEELSSPTSNEDLSKCLIILVSKDGLSNYIVDIDDSRC